MKNITKRGKWPKCSYPKRVSDSNSNLLSIVTVPVLTERNEDYRLEIMAAAADPSIEQELIGFCIRAVNAVPSVIDAMEFALEKLDSVAFLTKEGDTRIAKQSLRAAIEALRG